MISCAKFFLFMDPPVLVRKLEFKKEKERRIGSEQNYFEGYTEISVDVRRKKSHRKVIWKSLFWDLGSKLFPRLETNFLPHQGPASSRVHFLAKMSFSIYFIVSKCFAAVGDKFPYCTWVLCSSAWAAQTLLPWESFGPASRHMCSSFPAVRKALNFRVWGSLKESPVWKSESVSAFSNWESRHGRGPQKSNHGRRQTVW